MKRARKRKIQGEREKDEGGGRRVRVKDTHTQGTSSTLVPEGILHREVVKRERGRARESAREKARERERKREPQR